MHRSRVLVASLFAYYPLALACCTDLSALTGGANGADATVGDGAPADDVTSSGDGTLETSTQPPMTAAGCNASGGNWGTALIASGACDWTFLTPGNFAFAPPPGVTSVSVVCIGGGGGARDSNGGGGGGLGWANDVPVTPGMIYSVVVGAGAPGNSVAKGGSSYFISATTVLGGGGDPGHPSGVAGTADGGGFAGGGGGVGGSGGNAGGSGAGGYSGPGGNSGGAAGSGGGGGGGLYGTTGGGVGGGGGGVGIFGEGDSGAPQVDEAGGGYGGSGGTNGTPGSASGLGGSGGSFGGGAGGGGGPGGSAGNGACRIVWPGTVRRFPSTLVGPP